MSESLLFTAIACLGMLVQSFAGFAGSLVAIPLFALILSPKESIPAYNLVMMLIDAWLVFEARRYIQWNKVTKLLLGGVIGTPAGAYVLWYLSPDALNLVISIITLAFALLFVLKVSLPIKDGPGTQLSVGLLSGVLNGSISASGPPVVLYGLARAWDKDVFRTTLLTYFLCLSIIAVPFHYQLGLLSRRSLGSMAIAVIPCWLAAFFGVIFKNRIGEASFRRAVLIVVIGVSVAGIGRWVMH